MPSSRMRLPGFSEQGISDLLFNQVRLSLSIGCCQQIHMRLQRMVRCVDSKRQAGLASGDCCCGQLTLFTWASRAEPRHVVKVVPSVTHSGDEPLMVKLLRRDSGSDEPTLLHQVAIMSLGWCFLLLVRCWVLNMATTPLIEGSELSRVSRETSESAC